MQSVATAQADDPPAWNAQQLGLLVPDLARAAPDFLVIAPPKTGSTWLAANLRCHPELFVPEVKEVKYFSSYYKHLDLSWYLGHFQDGVDRVKGEVSPSYALLPVRRIRLLRALLPDVKLVFLMRDPVGRAWSHAKHTYRYREANFQDYAGKLEEIPLHKWWENFTHDWPLASGDYLGQLLRWLSVFPKEQIHLDFYESIARDPQTLLRRIFAFLGVSQEVDFSAFRTTERILEGPRLEISTALKTPLGLLLQERTRQLVAFLEDSFGIQPPEEWAQTSEALRVGDQEAQSAGDPFREFAEAFRREFDDDYLARVLAMEEHSLAPRLVRCGYRGYNVVLHRGQFYALAAALGPVYLDRMSDVDLLASQRRRGWLTAGSLTEALECVDQQVTNTLWTQVQKRGKRWRRWLWHLFGQILG
jgi:hypothetical protein